MPTSMYRPIFGCTGYLVGRDGSVWSVKRGHKKRLSVYRRPYKPRYCVVCLRRTPNGKVSCFYVHRLVLEAFVGLCPDGLECCHYDGDTSNNSLDNLAWVTHKENVSHMESHGTVLFGERNPAATLTSEDIASIRELLAEGHRQMDIANKFGVSQVHISRIKRGVRRVRG